MQRPTITDIARQVGVSKAAVSYALNGRAGVSPATRERILDTAAKLGWRAGGPGPAVSDRTGSIGIALPARPEGLRADGSALDWLTGVERTLAEHGLSAQLELVPDTDAELATYRRWCAERRVDGVIVTELRAGDRRLPLLRELRMPAVLVGVQDSPGGFAVLRPAEAAEARAVVEHLAARGHTRLGHVQPRSDTERHRFRASALRACARELLGTDLVKAEAGDAESGAVQATRRLLAADPPPTAIVYDSDRLAVAALAAELGVRVPAELAVLSWQDSLLCRVVSPPVTALEPDAGEQADAAVHLLLELIETGAADVLDLPPRALIPRSSTG